MVYGCPAPYIELCVMTSRIISLALFIFFVGWGTFARGAAIPTVKEVSVHLLLTPSGDLSPDVSEMKDFYSWNFAPFSKDLPSGQRFNSFLVKVRVKTGREAFLKGALGSIEVKSKANGRVLKRQVISNIYFPSEGEAVVGFFLQGIVCEPVLITARIGISRITKDLHFECGE